MPPAYVLALDQGTTSTRAVVYDEAGRYRGSAGSELAQHYPRPGWVEHDAEEIWASSPPRTCRPARPSSWISTRRGSSAGIAVLIPESGMTCVRIVIER